MGSIITRDNMNYQEYDWYFNPGSAPVASSTTMKDPWLTTGGFSTVCIGSACCSSNQTYDASTNLCVDATTTETFTNNSTSTTPITESMINSVLTKTSGNMKTDYTIDGNNKVKPSSSNSFINFGMNK
jgi:hypothetical protein